MTKNNEAYPQMRFKGFNDDWKQRKVSELADRYDNLRVPITASERVAGETPYYGANGIQDYVEGFTHDGEFILVAEDGANDLQNYPVQYVDGKVWVNNHAHVLQAKEETVDNKFLMNALKHTNIEPYLVGGGRAKLNADVMMKIDFKVPKLLEQVQLGKFFDNLDHLITLHKRKLAKLKELKKGYLQKLFPKQGEKVPEMRFKGFDDAWEQRKLIDAVENIGTGRSTFKIGIEYSEKTPYEVLGSTSVISYSSDFDHSGNFVLTARVGANAGKLYKYSGNVKISDNTVYIQSRNLSFVFYLLIEYDLKKLSFGTGQPLIKVSELKKIKLLFPQKIEEQEKIGEFFQQLDNSITTQQRKLNLIKDLKKGYLQKMFC